MVVTEILSNNMRPPFPDCYSTFWMMTIFSGNLHWSGITPSFDLLNLDLITELDILPYCERFPLYICNGCGIPTEEAYSSRHLVPSHFGTYKCSSVKTNLSWTCLVSGLLSFEHPSVLFFLNTTRYQWERSLNILGRKSVADGYVKSMVYANYVCDFYV